MKHITYLNFGSKIVAFLMKYCSRCREIKPFTDFIRCKRLGYQSYCRDCIRQYRIENREQILARGKERYYANREAKLAYFRAYRAAHAEKIAGYQKAYRLRKLAVMERAT